MNVSSRYISFKTLLSVIGENREQYVKNQCSLNRSRNGSGSFAHIRMGGAQRGESRVYLEVSALPAGIREQVEAGEVELYEYRAGVMVMVTETMPAPVQEALSGAVQAERAVNNGLGGLEAWITQYYIPSDVAFFRRRNGDSDAEGLAYAAAVLRLLTAIGSKKQAVSLGIQGVSSKLTLEVKILDLLAQKQVKGLSISNHRVLIRKQQEFLKSGVESLITAKAGNKNPQKLTEDAIDLIISLYAGWDGIKRTIAGVYRDYRAVRAGKLEYVDTETGEISDGHGLPEICYETIKQLVANPVVREGIFMARHGKKYAADFFRWYIHRKPLTYSMSLSSSDGWVMPYKVMKDGKVVGKNVAKHVAYLVFDNKTGAVLGYSYGGQENNALALECFSDMVRTAYSTYGGVVPIQNQLDNAGKSMKNELERVFRDVHYCEPYRGQSKKAERYIGMMEQMVCRYIQGWTGGNAGGKTVDFQVNPDFEDVGYTPEEGKALLDKIIRSWNAMIDENNGLDRVEYTRRSMNPNATATNLYWAALALGDEAVVTVNNSGAFNITRQVNRKRTTKQYYLPDYNEMLYRFRNDYRVRVIWLPWYEEKLWIFRFQDEKDRSADILLGEARPIPLVSGAHAEWDETDTAAMAEQMRHKALTDRRREEFEVRKIKVIKEEDEMLPEAERIESEAPFDTGMDKYEQFKFINIKSKGSLKQLE